MAVEQAMRIEAVDLRVAESSPPLVVARVRGIVPDSCSRRVSIEQRPYSTGVQVMVWVLRPPVGTPASLCSRKTRSTSRTFPSWGRSAPGPTP